MDQSVADETALSELLAKFGCTDDDAGWRRLALLQALKHGEIALPPSASGGQTPDPALVLILEREVDGQRRSGETVSRSAAARAIYKALLKLSSDEAKADKEAKPRIPNLGLATMMELELAGQQRRGEPICTSAAARATFQAMLAASNEEVWSDGKYQRNQEPVPKWQSIRRYYHRWRDKDLPEWRARRASGRAEVSELVGHAVQDALAIDRYFARLARAAAAMAAEAAAAMAAGEGLTNKIPFGEIQSTSKPIGDHR